jgi:hypothetical protein
MGMFIIIIVAIVVTFYTAGAATPWLASLMGGTVATLGTTAAAVAVVGGAMIGAAVGSAVSQGVGIAIGAQDKFDWKALATSTIAAGVTAGIGMGVEHLAQGGSAFAKAVTSFADKHKYIAMAMNGAASSILTQGIAVATGLQSSFNWRQVAISGLSQAAGMGFGKALERIDPDFGQFGQSFANSVGGALVGKAFGSGQSNLDIAVQAFASAIGTTIAGTNAGKAQDEVEERDVSVAAKGGTDSPPPLVRIQGPVGSEDETITTRQYTQPNSTGGTEIVQEVEVAANKWTFAQEMEYQRLIAPWWASRRDGKFGGGMAGRSDSEIAQRAADNVHWRPELQFKDPQDYLRIANANAENMRMLRMFSPLNLVGAGELTLTAATGLTGTIANGWANIVLGDPEFGMYLQQEMTWAPRLQISQDMARTALEPAANGIDWARNKLGDSTFAATDSAGLAAAAQTLPDAISFALMPEARGAFGSAGRGLRSGLLVAREGLASKLSVDLTFEESAFGAYGPSQTFTESSAFSGSSASIVDELVGNQTAAESRAVTSGSVSTEGRGAAGAEVIQNRIAQDATAAENRAASTVAPAAAEATQTALQRLEGTYGREIETVPGTHSATARPGSFGEQVAFDTLEAETGMRFRPLQNNSGHGADGAFIDYDSQTIFVGEAKQSVDGLEHAAVAEGNPATKIRDWSRKAANRERYWRNSTEADVALGREIQQALRDGFQVYGVQIQVGVPAVGQTAASRVLISRWR